MKLRDGKSVDLVVVASALAGELLLFAEAGTPRSKVEPVSEIQIRIDKSCAVRRDKILSAALSIWAWLVRRGL
jgi:hypothetical protein